MSGYVLPILVDSDIFEIEISIAEVNRLKPHEAVIRPAVRKLVSALRTTPYQKNPIIVDKSTGVILDGMHRWHAFRELGVPLITVCYVNYFDPRIGLGSWARLYSAEFSEVLRIIRGSGFSVLRKPPGFGHYATVRSPGDMRYVLLSEGSILEAYLNLDSLERDIRKAAGEPAYVSEDYEGRGVLIVPPRLTKEDVVATASAGRVFPPKSTRHEIPARPLCVNVPLEVLKSDPDDARECLLALLRQKTLFVLPPGVKFERMYKETIALFWG